MSSSDVDGLPLQGVRVVELGGQGPTPFAGMVLADAGAEIIRVERPGAAASADPRDDVLGRGRRSIDLDLRSADGRDALLRLVSSADALIEGYRPGVLERLGIGPVVLHQTKPSLVVGRATGWGQDGPLAQAAGHDISYLAHTGFLDAIGTAQEPVVPLSIVGDYGGGGMFLAFGVLAGILRARRSGRGTVVDAAIVDGVAAMGALIHSLRERGQWGDRATNVLDGGAPYYRVYSTSDGRFLSVGAIEPKFYEAFLAGLELDPRDFPQKDRSRWPAHAERFAEVFARHSSAHWQGVFEGSDACVALVLTLDEAVRSPHLRDRNAYVDVDGRRQPAAAPRFDGRWAPARVAPRRGEHTEAIRSELYGPSPVNIWEERA